MLFVLPLLNLAAAAVIVHVAESPDAARRLQGRGVVYIGRISYGIYLWHAVPIAVFGPVGVLAAVPIAALSHRFVEQPFLKRRARPGRRQSSMVPSVAGQAA